MVEEITQGIGVTVKPIFVGQLQALKCKYQAFKYHITIKNYSNSPVQLLKRHWEIYDSLNDSEIVDGIGVVGKTPIIEKNDSYTYQSNAYLLGHFGAMKGYYIMYNPISKTKFKVSIPLFKLEANPSLN